MIVEFRCQNRVTVPAGHADFCNQLLKAELKHSGKQVRCPKCQQMNTIPQESNAAPLTNSAQEADPTDVPQTGSKQLAYSQFDPYSRCPECGSLLNKEKKCIKCRYEQRSAKTDDDPVEEIKPEPAGLQLFIHRKLNNLDAGVAALIGHVVFVMFCFAAGAFSLLLLGCVGVVLVLFLFLLAVLYVIAVVDIRRVTRKPAAKLSVWQQATWQFMLGQIRSTDWKSNYVDPERIPVVDLRGQSIDDNQLFMLPELSTCRVLDLEGTQITDRGLIALRSCPQLRYLVLNNTQVTAEGVFRLQQVIRKTWIWNKS